MTQKILHTDYIHAVLQQMRSASMAQGMYVYVLQDTCSFGGLFHSPLYPFLAVTRIKVATSSVEDCNPAKQIILRLLRRNIPLESTNKMLR